MQGSSKLEIDEVLKKKGWANFSQYRILDEGMKHICKSEYNNFNEAKLDRNGITAKGMIYLSQMKWERLSHLALDGNNIGSIGCKYLSRASIPKLAWLNLAGNSMQTAGVLHLAKANWKQLKVVSLYSNDINHEGVRWLVMGNWRIEVLVLSNNLISFVDTTKRLLLLESKGFFKLTLNLWAIHYQCHRTFEVRKAYLLSLLQPKFRKEFKLFAESQHQIYDH